MAESMAQQLQDALELIDRHNRYAAPVIGALAEAKARGCGIIVVSHADGVVDAYPSPLTPAGQALILRPSFVAEYDPSNLPVRFRWPYGKSAELEVPVVERVQCPNCGKLPGGPCRPDAGLGRPRNCHDRIEAAEAMR